MRRIRAEGLTVLIVEQNVQQVLDVVDRAYLLEVGQHQARRHRRASSRATTSSARSYMGLVAAMDIYLLEAIINGILLGGVLALLALGLNLIFGVIDVVWIAYADLVMCGMYVVYWLYAELRLAAAAGLPRRHRRRRRARRAGASS